MSSEASAESAPKPVKPRKQHVPGPKNKSQGRYVRPTVRIQPTEKQLAYTKAGDVECFNAKNAIRNIEREELNAYVLDPNVAGEDKQHARGRSSNTGGVIPLSLSNCEMLMKGHKGHDAQLQQLFADPEYTTAVLWPGDRSISPTELKEIAIKQTGGRIAIIAVDATWTNAMRMKTNYPEHALHAVDATWTNAMRMKTNYPEHALHAVDATWTNAMRMKTNYPEHALHAVDATWTNAMRMKTNYPEHALHAVDATWTNAMRMKTNYPEHALHAVDATWTNAMRMKTNYPEHALHAVDATWTNAMRMKTNYPEHALHVMDATWTNAMRMKTNYPAHAIHVMIDAAQCAPEGQKGSLLAHSPANIDGDLATWEVVSTLEATAALLRELEEPEEAAVELQESMLMNCKIKVDASLSQKSLPSVYSVPVDASLSQKSRPTAYGVVDEKDLMPEYFENLRITREERALSEKEDEEREDREGRE
eukprot:gene1983-33401_t